MISGQWFQRKRSKNWQKLHKITHNSMKNMGSTPIFNKLGRGPTKKTFTQNLKQICAAV